LNRTDRKAKRRGPGLSERRSENDGYENVQVEEYDNYLMHNFNEIIDEDEDGADIDHLKSETSSEIQ